MKRNGKKLADLEDGHPRRMSDARNAWRKMNEDQRRAFLDWIRFDEDSPASYAVNQLVESPEEPLS